MRNIVFYKTSSDKSPIEDFLDTLSSKQAQKITWVLKLIEDFDVVPSQYFKKMKSTDDLWEVRVSIGSNIFRFLGFFDSPSLVVLAHGFQKKSQTTPKRAIKVAEKRKHDYLKRRKDK